MFVYKHGKTIEYVKKENINFTGESLENSYD